MESTDQRLPQARDEGLVIHELADETLVYDLERHRAHALNRTAAWVWRHADGRTSVAEMAALLQHELGILSGEDAVWLALDRLGRARLLRKRMPWPQNETLTSRRELVRMLVGAGGLALVTSISAPAAASTASWIPDSACVKNGGPHGKCCSGSRKLCSCNGGGNNCSCNGAAC